MGKAGKPKKEPQQNDSGKGHNANKTNKGRDRSRKSSYLPKFKEAEESLEDYIFDVGRSDLFDSSIKQFIIYIGKAYTGLIKRCPKADSDEMSFRIQGTDKMLEVAL